MMLCLMFGLLLIVQDMTKFNNNEDDGYEKILGELRRWVKRLQPALGTAPTQGIHA